MRCDTVRFVKRYRGISRRWLARQLGYPLDLYIADMAIEYPPDFIEMATKLYETGRISWMRLCELMAWVGIDPVSLELRHPEDPDHVV
ncbi:MAG: hypothetical protein ACYDDN_00620 [Candidatus Desulforudaceae bacterium]